MGVGMATRWCSSSDSFDRLFKTLPAPLTFVLTLFCSSTLDPLGLCSDCRVHPWGTVAQVHRKHHEKARNPSVVTPTCCSTFTKTSPIINYLKGALCEIPFLCGSALLLFYSVGAMASCNYIPLIMFNNVILMKQKVTTGSAGLDQCNGKLMVGLKTLKSCGEILISHPK